MVEQGLGHLVIPSSSFHFLNKTPTRTESLLSLMLEYLYKYFESS